jgi:hypothetical protein
VLILPPRRPWVKAPADAGVGDISHARECGARILSRMVYCVVPRELEADLFARLTDYYADDPEVKVIVDRRVSERRSRRPTQIEREMRELRDRRRRRIVGEFAPLVA